MSTKKVIEQEEPKITSEIARQMLEQDKRERERKCNDELQALIKRYNCTLVARCTIINTQVMSDVLIVANG